MNTDRFKFRVWHTIESRMFYELWCIHSAMTYINSPKCYLPDELILMQCTGLKDFTKWEELSLDEQKEWCRNHTSSEWEGKLIYEGDVVEIYDKESEVYHPGNPEIPRVGCVFWDDEYDVVPGWYIKGKPHPRYSPGRNPFYGYEGQDFQWRELKVVGNIYENPELVGE